MADIEVDRTGLKAFTRQKERDTALFFQGRTSILEDIAHAVTDAAQNIRSGSLTTSATRLLYGAPGAGKTSLLTEIQVRARRGAFGTPGPTVIDIDCEHLKHERDLVLILAKHFKKEGVFRTVSHEQASIGAHLLNILQGSVQKGQSQDPPEATFGQLDSLYTAAGTPSPILLCIDEIQNIQPEAKAMVSRLHQGTHRLPIIPIYAGLGNSLNVLMRQGVSRPVHDYVHSVGPLTKEEAQAVVTQMLGHFKVDQRGVDRDWPATLAQRSDGWPQHLHNAQRALALELIRPEVQGELARVKPEAVFTYERRYRIQAYGWRMSEMLTQTKGLAAQVMHALLTTPKDRTDVESLVLRLDQNAPTDPVRRRYSLPKGIGAGGYVEHMMHQGVLQEFPAPRGKNFVQIFCAARFHPSRPISWNVVGLIPRTRSRSPRGRCGRSTSARPDPMRTKATTEPASRCEIGTVRHLSPYCQSFGAVSEFYRVRVDRTLKHVPRVPGEMLMQVLRPSFLYSLN